MAPCNQNLALDIGFTDVREEIHVGQDDVLTNFSLVTLNMLIVALFEEGTLLHVV